NDPGVQTSDNYYPNVTTVRTGLPSMSTLGDFTVTYTATDGAGNTSTVTRLVKVVDRIAPEIQLLGTNPFEHVRFKPYVEPGIKLKDNYYSDSTLQTLLIIDQSKLDVSMSGIYFVTYEVTDPSGNKSKKAQRLVSVVEVTGLSELSNNNNVSIYPNPSKGQFTIANKTNTTIKTVKVMDAMGRIVLEKTAQFKEVEVDLTSMNKGLYMVIIKDANGNEYSGKVVLE
ncbi:MAG: immunoglobulin-like domain-containing protein, partial [Bacteroidota bacterium]